VRWRADSFCMLICSEPLWHSQATHTQKETGAKAAPVGVSIGKVMTR
jgi:hypothetical protein